MEAASKKRGRPKKHDDRFLDTLAKTLYPGVTTARHRQSLGYANRVSRSLIVNDKFVRGVEHLICDNPERFRVGVLEQLGRFQEETGCSDKQIRQLAKLLSRRFAAEPDMTVRKAMALVRQARLAAREN